MPVYACSGCSRFISLSIGAGGNPVAKADPERWAQAWRRCLACAGLFCERCTSAEADVCPTCSGKLKVPDRELLFRIYFGGPAVPAEGEEGSA
jgi:DNA-directed RNA polymerase subunit RPC12/RpoP